MPCKAAVSAHDGCQERVKMLAHRRRTPYKRTVRQRRWGILFAVIAPVAVSLALIPLRGEMVPVNESLVLVVVVLVAAVVGGRAGGVAAALVAAASFDFFFTRPYYSFTMRSSASTSSTRRRPKSCARTHRGPHGRPS
jgi:K+-sensing histidine kinase KdpD